MSTLTIGISSFTGGGKTTITKRVVEQLPSSVAIHFDDYDVYAIHPSDFRTWLNQGADFNAWEIPNLVHDLKQLKSGQSIIYPSDNQSIHPQKYIVIDYPLGYAHKKIGAQIDYMVFIDTPLDIAMARRLLRDTSNIEGFQNELTSYLDYGRRAYIEMDQRIKPTCDLIVDGSLSVDQITKRIIQAISNKNGTTDLS